MVNIKVKTLHEDAVMPKYATEGAVAFDLVAIEGAIITAGETRLIRTGLAFEIPRGYEMQIRDRSGLALKTKMRVANAPGTIDSDFRGEVCIIIENVSSISYEVEWIRKGDRIAQAVIQRLPDVTLTEVTELSETERGEGGFGHTGIN